MRTATDFFRDSEGLDPSEVAREVVLDAARRVRLSSDELAAVQKGDPGAISRLMASIDPSATI